ncbi:hypothetical protein EMIT048CA2_110181 [Pseudomonas chlororaphis]
MEVWFWRACNSSHTKTSVTFSPGEFVLWRLYVGHPRVRRFFSPVFHTCVRLPPLMWK